MHINLVSEVCIGSGSQSHVSHQEGQGSIPEHSVKFVVDNVTLGQVFPPSTLFFPLSASFNECSVLTFIYTLLLPDGQAGLALRPSKHQRYFKNRTVLDIKVP
jgi:hypothetical protein